MTAVRPSRARALASGPASSARPGCQPFGELEAERLRVGVVTADERVLLGWMVGAEAPCGQRVQSGENRTSELRLDALCQRLRVGRWEHADLREAELGRDREHGRLTDRGS